MDDSCCVEVLVAEGSDSSTEGEDEGVADHLVPKGNWDGSMLKEYTKYINGKPQKVDCSKAIPVYVDLLPHELKGIDDSKEEFRVVFVLKFWWLDPKLKNFKSTLLLQDAHCDHLRDVEVIVRSLDRAGTLCYEELTPQGHQGPRQVKRVTKDQYVHLGPADWDRHFFPDFSFINQQSCEEGIKTQKQELLWCDHKGGFVQCKMKHYAVFQETLELHAFPVDRQICRIRLTSEQSVEDFQFVALNPCRKLRQVCDMWTTDPAMEAKEGIGACTVYVRPPDPILEGRGHVTQRSSVNAVLHVQRKPAFFAHSVLLMVSLITVISLCAFSLTLDHPGSRLGFLSTCFLAVLAYRYVINSSLPGKSYMTDADWFITQACYYQTWLCFETAFLTFFWCHSESRETLQTIEALDWSLGGLTALWYAHFISCYWRRWQEDTSQRQSWQQVYQNNTEPYCPVERCGTCNRSWLSKQSTHRSNKKTCRDCQGQVITTYYSPLERRRPLVPSLWDQKHPDEVVTYIQSCD